MGIVNASADIRGAGSYRTTPNAFEESELALMSFIDTLVSIRVVISRGAMIKQSCNGKRAFSLFLICTVYFPYCSKRHRQLKHTNMEAMEQCNGQ